MSSIRHSVPILAKIGQERQCSESLINDMEAFICAIYGGSTYSNINKLRYDMFLRKYSSSSGSNVINVSDGTDMSLLPPCRSALEMHIRRVNYQVFIWVRAHENSTEKIFSAFNQSKVLFENSVLDVRFYTIVMYLGCQDSS